MPHAPPERHTRDDSADASPVIVYVDVNKAVELSGDDVPDGVRQIKAFGMTSSTDGRETTLRIPVTFV